jgi:hypothetical protein
VRGALVVGRPVVGHRCETRAAPDSLSESRTGCESFANVSMHGGLAFSVAAASIFGGRHVGLGIPQAKRLLCRFHLHHKWVRRFNPEGEDYLQCNACGKDLYDVGRAGLLAFNSLAGHRKARLRLEVHVRFEHEFDTATRRHRRRGPARTLPSWPSATAPRHPGRLEPVRLHTWRARPPHLYLPLPRQRL